MIHGADHLEYVTRCYIDDAVNGRADISPLVQVAAKRHFADLDSPRWYVDWSKAYRAVKFFESLRPMQGSWPLPTIELWPWALFGIASLFGWRERSSDLRRFQSGYWSTAKKSGKSTIAAGIANYMTFLDGEPGAEGYCAATSRDQAKVVWKKAKWQAEQHPILRQALGDGIRRHTLSRADTASRLVPLSSDTKTMDGINPHCAVIDELHLHRDRRTFDTINESAGARSQPLVPFVITTAGEHKYHISYEQYEYAKRVVHGEVKDDRHFVLIHEAAANRELTDRAGWREANPGIGLTPTYEDLARKLKQARSSPAAMRHFDRKRLNRWQIGESAFLDTRDWGQCGAGAQGINWPEKLRELKGRPCYVGLDMSSRRDLTARVRLFPPKAGGLWYLDYRCWITQRAISEWSNRWDLPIYDWLEAANLTECQGGTIDHASVADDLKETFSRYRVLGLGHDAWQSAPLVSPYERRCEIEQVRMTYRDCTAPLETLATLVADQQIAHSGDPLVLWQGSQLHVLTADDRQRPVKPDRRDEPGRIDILAASIMALYHESGPTQVAGSQQSQYVGSGHGPLVLS